MMMKKINQVLESPKVSDEIRKELLILKKMGVQKDELKYIQLLRIGDEKI
jgi:hypothetical protein